MKKILWGAFIVYSSLLAGERENKHNIPVPNQECGKVITLQDFSAVMSDVRPNQVFRGYQGTYDANCDGKPDLKTIVIESKNPLIYMVDRNQDGKFDEFYYDCLRDDINGNEEKCKDLSDCLDKAFVGKRVNYRISEQILDLIG